MTFLILAYHRVCDADDPLAVRPADFRRQLAAVARRWRVVPLAELVEQIVSGRGESGERLATVTFDDGYRDNAAVAAPILRELGLAATFFLAAGFLGKRCFPRKADPAPGDDNRMMSWAEAADLAAGGFTVGAHTLTHANLAGLPAAEAEAEIRGAKDMLENRLGRPVEFFCYPGGQFTPDTIALTEAAGYRAAVVTRPFRLGPRAQAAGRAPGRFALPRVGVYRHTGAAAFRLKTMPILQGRAR